MRKNHWFSKIVLSKLSILLLISALAVMGEVSVSPGDTFVSTCDTGANICSVDGSYLESSDQNQDNFNNDAHYEPVDDTTQLGSPPLSPDSTQTIPLNKVQKNLDDVWIRIASLINPQLSNKIYLPSIGFTDYQKVYSLPIVSAITSFSPVPSGKGRCFNKAISANQEEVTKNLVVVNFQNKRIQVHKIVAPLIREIDQEISQLSLQYRFDRISSFSWRCINSPLITISDRNTCEDSNGKTRRSTHSYGTTIDINPQTNPFCVMGDNNKMYTNTFKTTECSKFNNRYYDLPNEVINIFKRHDFTWGGDWSPAKDYMHFEWNGNKGDFENRGTIQSCSS